MKLKLQEILGKMDNLTLIMTQKIPVGLAYNISKMFNKLKDERVIFEELRIKLCKDYCDKDDKNEPIMITDSDTNQKRYSGLEGNTEFIEKFTELSNKEINIDFKPIPIKELETANVLLSAQEVLALGELIGG